MHHRDRLLPASGVGNRYLKRSKSPLNSELAGRASVFGAEGGRRIRTFVGISRRPCQNVRSLLGSGLVAGEGFEPS